MADYIAAYSREDGSTPLISDADDGRLYMFRPELAPTDHRGSLALAALLFARGDLKAQAGRGVAAADVVWGLGPEAAARFGALAEAPVTRRSVAFPHGGTAVLQGNGCHMFLDAAPLGFEDDLVHGHLDTLGFELAAPGGTFLCDSGSYVYTSDVEAYTHHVRTAAHNTIVVDDQDIVPLRRLWHVDADTTRPRLEAWSPTGEEQVWEASHRGYTRLPDPVVHRRRVTFRPSERCWTIRDRLEGTGTHRVAGYFHLHPDVTLVAVAGRRATLRRGSGQLEVEGPVDWQVEQGWVAERYGVRRRGQVLVARLEREVPLELETTIRWAPAAGAGKG
jgi:hypothetical protein